MTLLALTQPGGMSRHVGAVERFTTKWREMRAQRQPALFVEGMDAGATGPPLIEETGTW